MADEMGVAHAVWGGSNCGIWLNCAEAGRFMKAIKGTASAGSIYAATGTAAHFLGENSLVFGYDTITDMHRGTITQVGEFEIPIDDDMLNAVKVFHDYVSQRVMTPGVEFWLEQTVSLDHIWIDAGLALPSNPLFGTADVIAVGEQNLDIMDYKHGSGVPIEADTEQGLYYAAGALRKFGYNLPATALVTVHIIQPRAPHSLGPVRTKTYTILDIKNFEARVRVAIDAIESGKGGYNIGKWCRFCPKLSNCPAQFKQNIAIARGDFNVTQNKIIEKEVDTTAAVSPPDVGFLSPEELAFILNFKDMIRRWLDAVEQEARRQLANNVVVPGYKLVDKRELKAWAVDLHEAARLLPQALINRIIETDLISPAQARKVLSKEEFQALLDAGIIKSASTGTTLAPVSDKRPAVTPGVAALRDFVSQVDAED